MSRPRPPIGAPAPSSTDAFRADVLATAKGSGFLAGGTIFEYASRFVIALLLARFLGAQEYGLYVLAISVATIVAGLSSLGLDDAVTRYVAIMSGRRDDPGIWGTLRIGFGVSLALGLVMGLVLFLGARPVAEGIFDEPRLTSLLRLFAVVVPFLLTSNLLAATARGFRRMGTVALAESVVQSLLRMGLLLLLALFGQLNLYAAAVIFGISDVAASVTMFVLISRWFPLRHPIKVEARHQPGAMFRFAIPLWISRLLRQFRRNIEVVLLGAFASVASVGVFAVVTKVNLVAHVFLLALMTSVRPILAQLHDRGERDGLGHLYTTTTRWALTLNLPFFVVTVLYPEAILSIFGEAFTAGATALIILAVAELVNAATGICGALLEMTGHVRVKLVNSVAYTTLLIGGSALLIPRWGLVGAATAFAIATVTVNLAVVVEVWVLERLLPFHLSFWKPVVAGLGAMAMGVTLMRWSPVGADLGLAVLQGTLVAGVYGGLILALGLASEERDVIVRARSKAVLALRRQQLRGRARGGSGR